MSGMHIHDYLIIGAGIAGASLAYRLRDRGSVLVADMESQAGYHTTGRSAAMFMETYGTPTIQALTRASRDFYEHPPAGFCEHALLAERGVLYIAREGQQHLLAQAHDALSAAGARIRKLSAAEVVAQVPCIKAEGLLGAIAEPEAMDVDANAVLQGFVKGARADGTQFLFKAGVVHAERRDGVWQVALANGQTVRARAVVNAAGAWADQMAMLFGAAPVGLTPKRRSAFTFKAPETADPAEVAHWPAVVGIDESYYFKPDAGQLLGSPANADPVEPHDVVAEELDVALGIDRIETATHLSIRRPTHTWAGLRSFVADGEFVIGWDTRTDGFFWLAGQGGYGIQTSPGASLLAANLLLQDPLDASLQQWQVDPRVVSPARFGATHE
ncbi:FAD-binding oxidoreductase [Bordetella sp. BOR01]|uniref:NAD(P)/FAD-dependent oxidoreductase n=1 Tax=Bordetella sp. BOR01 TaxID=2854779 RepID=UPI001C436BCF|nr:FAD-dependent oxidoreductase [Bordetella sp. BOR01]MBV7483917.1 FAD-binding oxidoreductase [Bordetella sp. BOR01]